MKRSRELEQLTRGLYEAVSTSDASFFARHLSRRPGCVVIGTAPHEWWEQYASAVEAIRHQMEAVGDAVELVAGQVRGYEDGEVGWVADRPTIKLGGIEVHCRHTSVFIREDGGWQLVQDHFSIGAANEDAFGEHAPKLG